MTQRRKDKLVRAAARGAAWLDKNVPGWSRKVRRKKLDLASCRYCVLGQIGGAKSEDSYGNEVATLDLTEDQIFWFGFDAGDCDYETLTEAWRDELKTRPRYARD